VPKVGAQNALLMVRERMKTSGSSPAEVSAKPEEKKTNMEDIRSNLFTKHILISL
jgi:hypothetical protein